MQSPSTQEKTTSKTVTDAKQCHTATPNNTNKLSSQELSSITLLFLTWSHF